VLDSRVVFIFYMPVAMDALLSAHYCFTLVAVTIELGPGYLARKAESEPGLSGVSGPVADKLMWAVALADARL